MKEKELRTVSCEDVIELPSDFADLSEEELVSLLSVASMCTDCMGCESVVMETKRRLFEIKGIGAEDNKKTSE